MATEAQILLRVENIASGKAASLEVEGYRDAGYSLSWANNGRYNPSGPIHHLH